MLPISRLFIFQLSFLFFLMSTSIISYAQNENVKSDEFGFLKIKTNLDSFYVVVNNDFSNAYQMTSSDSISLHPGRINIRIVSKTTFDHKIYVDIKPNEILEYSIKFSKMKMKPEALNRNSAFLRIYWGVNLIIYTDDDSDIWIDNKKFGMGL